MNMTGFLPSPSANSGNGGHFFDRQRRATSRAGRRLGMSAAAACAVVGLALAAAPAASAYVRINSRCILRAFEPFWGGGSDYFVSGEVDCSGYGAVESKLEVCSQVYNADGKWYTVSGSCVTTPWEFIAGNWEGNYVKGVNGHTYRTWDKGWLASDGASAEYESSGFTCGCP